MSATSATSAALPDTVTQPPRAPHRPGPGRKLLAALPWLTPAIILIFGIVLYPAGYMIYTAFRKTSKLGTDKGPAGWSNFHLALTYPGVNIGRIFINTAIWVVVVVVVTVVISLGLAQFLNKTFRGRKLVRLAIIVPWAASVVMTTSVFSYSLNIQYGIVNRFFVDIGLIDQPYGFTQNATSGFVVGIIVAIFVSLPFTTYTVLAGLQTVPRDVIEAAHVDGASAMDRYTKIILPMLRPALAVATLINIINVINSLPILQILLQQVPGYAGYNSTVLVFWYQNTLGPGVASALSVINFLICLVVIAFYLIIVRPTKER